MTNTETFARQRLLLSTVAASGILNHNTATPMPKRFTESMLLDMLPAYRETDLLQSDLLELTEAGLLVRYNTGHSGYGNTYVEGPDVWYVSPQGLIHLWTESPVS